MSNFGQVGQFLRDITKSLVNGSKRLVASGFSFLISLLRGQGQVDVLEGERDTLQSKTLELWLFSDGLRDLCGCFGYTSDLTQNGLLSGL